MDKDTLLAFDRPFTLKLPKTNQTARFTPIDPSKVEIYFYAPPFPMTREYSTADARKKVEQLLAMGCTVQPENDPKNGWTWPTPPDLG